MLDRGLAKVANIRHETIGAAVGPDLDYGPSCGEHAHMVAGIGDVAGGCAPARDCKRSV
jgi:hypothetical protein